MTIIEQIKAEIERRLQREREVKDRYDSNTSLFVEGSIDALEGLLSFLSTLESEKPVPVDLEEAAKEYAYTGIPDEMKRIVEPLVEQIIKIFIAGAKWQADHAPLPEDTVLFNKGVEEGKRLMMMDAVDAIVEDWNPDPEPEITIPLNPEEFTCGDKVRVIIVKED